MESIYFMHLIDVDLTTLLTLVGATCLGGVIGGLVVSRLNSQAIRMAMILCFICIIALLLAHRFNLIQTHGEIIALSVGV